MYMPYFYPNYPYPIYPSHNMYNYENQWKKYGNPDQKIQQNAQVEEKVLMEVKEQPVLKVEEQNSLKKNQYPEENTQRKIQHSTFKSEKKKKKADEYKPYRHPDKKTKKISQNAKRNIIPNVLHQIFSFIQKKMKSEKFVQKVLNEMKIEGASKNRFFIYQNFFKEKLNNYLNDQILKELGQIQEPSCKIYSLEQQKTYLYIGRMLAHYFLEKQLDQVILTSTRMKPESRKGYFSVKRQIKEKLVVLLRQANK